LRTVHPAPEDSPPPPRGRSAQPSAMPGANRPHGLGGPSTRFRRTIRTYGADCPKRAPEPAVAHPENWTAHHLPTDRSPRKDCPHSPCGPFAKHLATENHRLDRSKHELARTHKEHEEHPISRLLVDRPRAPGGMSTTRGQNSPSSTSTRLTPSYLHPISQINQGVATKS
jgi:hypothetical protein